jgi:hypothetical protein
MVVFLLLGQNRGKVKLTKKALKQRDKLVFNKSKLEWIVSGRNNKHD